MKNLLNAAGPRRGLPDPAASSGTPHHDPSAGGQAWLRPWFVVCCGGAVAAGGCGDEAAIRPGDIRVYTVPGPPAAEPPESTIGPAPAGESGPAREAGNPVPRSPLEATN